MQHHSSISPLVKALKKTRRSSCGAVSALVLAACSGVGEEPDGPESAESAITANGATANLVITNDWGAGYCALISVKNNTNQTASSWRAWVNLNGGTITSSWNYTGSSANGVLVVNPLSWGASMAPGQTRADAGFCASRSGSGTAVTTDVRL